MPPTEDPPDELEPTLPQPAGGEDGASGTEPADAPASEKKGVIGGAVEGGKKAVVGSAKAVAGGAKAVAGGAKVATVATVQTTRSFGFGFWCVMRGVGRLIATPAWWPYAIIPFILSLFAFVGVIWWLGGAVTETIDARTTQWLGETTGFVAWLLSLLVWIGIALVLFIYLFPALARLVAAPFMALFSDRVVKEIARIEPPTPPGTRLVRFVIRPIWEAFVLLLVRIVVMVIASPLLLIPVVGQILFALLIFPIEAMDLLDWAQSSRGVPLSRRLPFIRQHFSACMGLGAGSTLFLFIPVVNVFVLPSLVIGAVLLDQDLSPDFPGNAERALPAPEDAA